MPDNALALTDDPMAKQFNAMQAESTATQAKAGQAMDAQIATQRQGAAEMDATRAARPHAEKISEPPKSTMGDDASQWLAAATVMGAIAGALTRRHTTNALAAFTGVLEGAKEGNQAKFEQNVKAWEMHAKQVTANNKTMLDEYQAVIDDKKLSIDEKMQTAKLIAQKYQDELGFKTASLNEYMSFMQLIDRRREAHDKFDFDTKRLGLEERKTAVAEREEARKESLTKEGAITDEAMRFRVRQYLSTGDKSSMYNLGRGTQGAGNIARFNNLIPEVSGELGMSAEDVGRKIAGFTALAKADRDFSTGPQGNAIRSFGVALSHMDTLQQLGDALKNGDTQRVNALRNVWRQEFGSELPNNFNLAKQIVGTEVLKSVMGSGAGTGEERKQLADAWNSANSPEKIAGAIKTAQGLMVGQLVGLRQQYIQTTFGSEADFTERLSPAARRLMAERGGTSAPAPAAPAGVDGATKGGTTSSGVKWSIE